MALVLSLKSSYNKTHQSKTLIFAKGKLAVTNKQLQKSRRLYLMHSIHYQGMDHKQWFMIRARLKEFQGQNLQNFIPPASASAFGQRPNFLNYELWLWPNVKNMTSVIPLKYRLIAIRCPYVIINQANIIDSPFHSTYIRLFCIIICTQHGLKTFQMCTKQGSYRKICST